MRNFNDNFFEYFLLLNFSEAYWRKNSPLERCPQERETEPDFHVNLRFCWCRSCFDIFSVAEQEMWKLVKTSEKVR